MLHLAKNAAVNATFVLILVKKTAQLDDQSCALYFQTVFGYNGTSGFERQSDSGG